MHGTLILAQKMQMISLSVDIDIQISPDTIYQNSSIKASFECFLFAEN